MAKGILIVGVCFVCAIVAVVENFEYSRRSISDIFDISENPDSALITPTAFSTTKIILTDLAVPIDERLIGGKDAPDGAFPYVVSLRDSANEHLGTGTIISDSWILTIAQNIGELVSLVVVGTTKRSENGTTYKISQMVPHPNFKWGHKHDDIGLIKINGKLNFGPNIKAVELPTAPPANGTEVTIAGWGYTDYDKQTIPDKLQYINVTITDNDLCRRVCKTSICTIGPVGKGVCFVDNGDPVVANNVVFGVVSWLVPCAKGYPDGHTNVALYIDWIKKIIGN